jgi:hypothetical protein
VYVRQGGEFLNDEAWLEGLLIDFLNIQILSSLENQSFSLGLFAFENLPCVAHDSFTSFTRLASAQIFPFVVDFSPVD